MHLLPVCWDTQRDRETHRHTDTHIHTHTPFKVTYNLTALNIEQNRIMNINSAKGRDREVGQRSKRPILYPMEFLKKDSQQGVGGEKAIDSGEV